MRKTPLFELRLGLILSFVLGFVLIARASACPQETTAPAPTASPVTAQGPPATLAEVDAIIAELATATDLGEAELTSAKEMTQQSRQNLQSAEKARMQSQQFQADTTAAADNLKNARRALEQKKSPPETFSDRNLAEAKSELDKIDAELKSVRQQLTAQAGEASRRQTRLLELPELITAAEQKLEKTREQIEQLSSKGEAKRLADLRELNLKTQRYLLQQEVKLYESERQFYNATTELVPLEQELLQRKAERLQNQVASLTLTVESKRENEIEKIQRQLNEQLDRTPEPLQVEAKINVELVDQYVADSKRLAEVNASMAKTRKTLEEIETEFKTSKERVEAVGLNDTLGLMFRRSKSTLANQRRTFQADSSLQTEIRNLQVGMFRLQDLLKQASETDASIAQMLDANRVKTAQRDALRNDVTRILKQRREIISQLSQTKTELFNRLVSLDVDQRKVVNAIDAFTDYINEHVLWIRSSALVSRDDLPAFNRAIQWLMSPSRWEATGSALKRGVESKFGLLFLLGSALLFLLTFGRRLKVASEAAGKVAELASCRVFHPTATAVISTCLIAATWPLCLLSIGWLLLDVSAVPFVQAMAKSLMLVAITMYPLEVLKQSFRNHGLGQSHFGWSEDSRKFIRGNLRWLVLVLPPLLLLVNLMQYQPTEEFRSSLGRAAMTTLLTVLFVFAFKMLHPRSQFYRGMDVKNRGQSWRRFRVVWFVAAFIVYAGFMFFTIAGYYYTAYQIGSKLLQSIALSTGVALTYCTSVRWLLVRRRRMRVEQLAAKREELKRKQLVDSSLGESARVDLPSESGLDANSVSKQARELLLAGIGFFAVWIGWLIWADVFPAVGILDRVKLWSVSIDGIPEVVTLQNLLYFSAAAAGTVIAVKNLPGLLELLLLKRLPMDAGARYAVATIVRYILSVLGMIVAFAFLKVQWSQFSWLIAAISLGLGFGLQEIVANFVSGLILLLERPVRIGDVVTIEGTTGIVSKIQMRATTVTNWDQQELVVPNKNLITNSIFNWTLSNVLTRITLELGVAYGSDPEYVKDVVLEVVKAHPLVLTEPAATVTFQTFGDSSLNFVIRCCISGPDKRLATIHDLQVAINNRLAQEKIEIPFPQRVLHTFNAEATAAQLGAKHESRAKSA